jgi:hypothetical protein
LPLAVGDAGDGRCRVGSNARQQAQFLRRLRQVALVVVGYKLRRFVQHARPPVVAQPAPQGQYLFFRR